MNTDSFSSAISDESQFASSAGMIISFEFSIPWIYLFISIKSTSPNNKMSQKDTKTNKLQTELEIQPNRQQSPKSSESPPTTSKQIITGKTLQSDPNVQPSYSSRSHRNAIPIQVDLITFRICQVIIPVALCALYVVLLTRIIDSNVFRHSPTVLDKTWYHLGLPGGVLGGAGEDETAVTKLVNNIIIVAVFFVLLVLVTLLILLILYMECHACLVYYFYLPSLIIMAVLTPAYLKELLLSLNWFGLDLITLAILDWNFTVLGMMTIFNIYVSGPLCLQQAYLIHNSGLLAVLLLSILPGWAPWMLLGFLVFWDLFAVLAPFGPLNLIINMAEREGIVDMPGLIYTTDMRGFDGGPAEVVLKEQPTTNVATKISGNEQVVSPEDGRNQTRSKSPEHQKLQRETRESNAIKGSSDSGFKMIKETSMKSQLEVIDSGKNINNDNRSLANGDQVSDDSQGQRRFEERGLNIGLGDFIFYSLLIGLTSKGHNLSDFYMTVATLEALLVGVVLTLIILVMTRKALPALPISIALGLVTAALTGSLVIEFSNTLAAQQIFI